MTELAVIDRPGGKPYRARKPPQAVYWDDDETAGGYGVCVVRTHDVDQARKLATECFRSHLSYLDELPEPIVGWVRFVPWPGDGSIQPANPGDRNAVPAVVFTAPTDD